MLTTSFAERQTLSVPGLAANVPRLGFHLNRHPPEDPLSMRLPHGGSVENPSTCCIWAGAPLSFKGL